MIRRLLRLWWVRWIVLPVVAISAALACWELVLKWTFEARIEELRATGAPVDLRDLVRPPVPDEDNAAIALGEAHRWHDENLKPEPARLHLGENEWSEEDRAEIVEWLGRGAPYVELLAHAASKPAFQEGDWEDGVEIKLPVIVHMQEATTFLEHRVRLADRATPQELADLALVLDLASTLDHSALIVMLVRWTVQGIAANTLEALASKPGFDAREARALLDPLFTATDDPDAPRVALQAERVVGLSLSRRWIAGESPAAILRRTLEGDDEPTLLDHLYGSGPARPFAYRDALRLLDLMEKELRLVDLPPREAFLRAQALREQYVRGPPNVFSRLFATVPMLTFRARLRHEAMMRIARTGLAVLELRQTTGAWPESLDAVVPIVGEEWATDPFTGGRLRYEPGVRLEAAAPILDEEQREDDEIVWRFPTW